MLQPLGESWPNPRDNSDSDASRELCEEIIAGTRRALASDFVDAYQVSIPVLERADLPFDRYLAKVVFLKLDLDKPNAFPLQLAISTRANNIDAEILADFSQNPDQSSPFTILDGVQLDLLNNNTRNLSSLGFSYLPVDEINDTNDGFYFHSINHKVVRAERNASRIIDNAYNIARDPYAINRDNANLEDMTTIAKILREGSLDTETKDNLERKSRTNRNVRLINDDVDALRMAIPYLKSLTETALRTQKFQDNVALMR